MVLLLAISWLPVTSHCLLLESAGALDFLACCTHDEVATHHEDDCATDSCAIVESAQYKSSVQRVTIPLPAPQIAFQPPPQVPAGLAGPAGKTHQTDDALGRLPRTWQFSCRTALPPRAPAFAS